MTIWIFFAVLAPALVSLWGTELVRRYALRTSMLDVPNQRSSHTQPTPRGGGIAIVGAIVAMLAILAWALPDDRPTTMGILGGGLLVAAIGWLDDKFSLSARLRLVIQIVASIWLLTWLGGVGSFDWLNVNWSWPVAVLAALFIVWSTNMYNFMDGLDGFAGGQAVVASTAAAFLCLRADDQLLAFTMLATSGAAAGFLVWNWPPAKIFMGDCGSGFLGFLFAAVALAAHTRGTFSLGSGLMLLLVFLADATLTLLRRIAQREKWYEAHRSHAYQMATRMGASHRQVTYVSLLLFAIAASVAVLVETQASANAFVAIAFALGIVGLWIAINCLFVGRSRTLSSINKTDGQVPPGESATAESARVLYLRFTRLQSQIRSRISIMPQDDLLSEATGVASRLGYTVSHDWLDGCGGGNVEAAGEKWILLDFNMTKRDQIRQILLTIHEEAEDLDTISDDLKSMLAQANHEATSAMPETIENRAA